MKECVGVQLGEDGAIIVVNEDAEWIIVSVDQKAHKQGGHWVHIIDHLWTTFKISLRLLYFAKFLEFSIELAKIF